MVDHIQSDPQAYQRRRDIKKELRDMNVDREYHEILIKESELIEKFAADDMD